MQRGKEIRKEGRTREKVRRIIPPGKLFFNERVQSSLDHPDLDYSDFSITQTCFSGPSFS